MSESANMEIARRLREARETLGLKQAELATKSGCSPSTYQKYEQGSSVPGGEAIAGFARLGINAHWLLTGWGSMLVDLPESGGPGDVALASGISPEDDASDAGYSYMSGPSTVSEQLAMYSAPQRALSPVADPVSFREMSEINSRLMTAWWRAAQTCHGDRFTGASVEDQLAYVVTIYNLSIRLFSLTERSPSDLPYIGDSWFADQLRLWVQAKQAPGFPPPAWRAARRAVL